MMRRVLSYILLLILCLTITACSGGKAHIDDISIETDNRSSIIGISKDKGLDVSQVDLNYTVIHPSLSRSYIFNGNYKYIELQKENMDEFNKNDSKLFKQCNPQFFISYEKSNSIYSLFFERWEYNKDDGEWKNLPFELGNSGLGTNSKYDDSIGVTEIDSDEDDDEDYDKYWTVFFDAKGDMVKDYHSSEVSKKLIENSGGMVYEYYRDLSEYADEMPGASCGVALHTTDETTMKNWIKNLSIPEKDIEL